MKVARPITHLDSRGNGTVKVGTTGDQEVVLLGQLAITGCGGFGMFGIKGLDAFKPHRL